MTSVATTAAMTAVTTTVAGLSFLSLFSTGGPCKKLTRDFFGRLFPFRNIVYHPRIARNAPHQSSAAEQNPGNNLHVSSLSLKVEERDLEAAFSKYGRVRGAFPPSKPSQTFPIQRTSGH